jgi:hypothetical protein
MLIKKVTTTVLWIAAIFSLPAFSQCKVPTELRTELAEKYAGWKIVTPDKLSRDDLETWKSLHPRKCPGLLQGRFVDGKESFAVALVPERAGKFREQVLLFERQESGLKSTPLVLPKDLAIINVLVKLPPGRYTSFDGTSTSYS